MRTKVRLTSAERVARREWPRQADQWLDDLAKVVHAVDGRLPLSAQRRRRLDKLMADLHALVVKLRGEPTPPPEVEENLFTRKAD